jgi:hypothetical protein
MTAEAASRAAQVHQLQDRLLVAEQLLEARWGPATAQAALPLLVSRRCCTRRGGTEAGP